MKNFSAILFFLIHFYSFSQFQISGRVKATLQPVEFANVVLMNKNDDIISGTITNDQGFFKLNVSKDNYILKISVLGYKDWNQEVNLNKDINLGIITISESENELGEVTITSKMPTVKRKVDRLVFNIKNSIVSTGGDAMDILQKTPGVRCKGSEISLLGKSNVQVMVNNQLLRLSGEDLSNYLRTLNSENISKIEVITNPPAKYEAEGNSGLINVILKNVKRNYFGGYLRTTYQQTTYPKGYVGGGVTYQKNKLSVFGNINTGKGSTGPTETNKVLYKNQLWDTESDQINFNEFMSGRAGIDYVVTKKKSIGIQYLGSTNRPVIEENIQTNIFNRSYNSIDSIIRTNGMSDIKNYYHSLNGHFKSELDSIGKNISIDVDYLKYKNTLSRLNNTRNYLANEIFVSDSNEILKNNSRQEIQSFTSILDVEWPLHFVKLSFGSKVSFTKNVSKIQSFNFKNNIYVLNSSQSNQFEYKENIQAAYVSAGKSLKKWDFKVGFRIETTQTEGVSTTLIQKNTKDYTKLFPTVYITYNPNENHSYSLNYGRRINRPNYGRLNPFKWYSNPFSFSEGNPFLQPSFADNMEFYHIFKDNLSTSLYFSKTTDGADQITLVENGSNIQATVWKNFIEDYTVGLIESYTFAQFDWLESYLQVNLSYLRVDSTIPNSINSQDGVNFNFSIDNIFYLNKNKTFMGEINFWYDAPGIDAVYDISDVSNLDMGLKILLFEKKMNLSLIVTDILKTNISTVKGRTNGIGVEYENYYDSRKIKLSVVYRIGNKKLRSKRRKFSNEEERKRTK